MDVPSGLFFFIDPPPLPPSHPAAWDLLAKLMEQEELKTAAQAAPERRSRPGWLRRLLGLGKRSRPS
jgi:hypothetical protein